MNVQFKKKYYNKAILTKGTNFKISNERKGMYQLVITENYFEEDKSKVLQQAIEDLRKELNRLEKIYEQNQKDISK